MCLIRSADSVALCVHMMYNMCMHSCLNMCLRENMCLNCLPLYAGRRACINADAPLCVSGGYVCLAAPAHPLVSVSVFFHVCACEECSRPYLVPAAGGVQQVPNCCRPNNGFYKPVAGTGLWLSCQLGSPPLYTCHLH